jgi:myo-inositol-1(or 4)-monophosphatase
MENINKFLLVAEETALIGGDILRAGFGTLFNISSKEGKNNLVTEYDLKAEKAIIENILKHFPDHEILAEESGLKSMPKSSYRWIIDPLDGTVNFAHNIPIFSVSIACEKDGEIICGVIFHPLLNEMFTASKGGGAYLNGKILKVSDNSELDNSILVTGFPYNVDENPFNCLGTFVNMVKKGIPVRRLGSAALDLVYVAAGRFDGFWEAELKPWDVAAGAIILTEAGGKLSDYDGKEYSIYGKTILATNCKIHDSALKVINGSQNESKSI